MNSTHTRPAWSSTTPRSRWRRHSPVLVVMVALVGFAACTGTDVTVSENSGTESSTEGGVTSTSVAASAPDDTTASTVDETPPASSAPSTTEPPPTTLPPRPVVTAQSATLQNSGTRGLANRPTDVVVAPGASTARMAINSLVGGRWVARIETINNDRTVKEFPLTVDGADDVRVVDLAATETGVAATGSMIAVDGTAHAVLWRSADGGETFEAGEVIPGALQRATTVATVADGTIVVVGWVDEPRPTKIVAARRDPSGNWTDTVLVDGAHAYDVAGAIAVNQTVVVTGWFDQGAGGDVGIVWTSTDGAVSFVPFTAGLESVGVLGVPVWTGSEFATIGEGRGNEPSKLVRSPDGGAWTPVELSLTEDGKSISAANRSVGPMIVRGDKLIVSFTNLLSDIATIDRDGRGTIAAGAYTDQVGVYFDALPYSVNGTLHLVSRSPGGYLLAAEQPGGWTYGDRDSTDSLASFTRLAPLGGGVVAMSGVSPDITFRDDGGIAWSAAETWNVMQDGSWIVADPSVVPTDSGALATNGPTDLSLDYRASDPGDDDLGGPLGGTTARLRSVAEGTWSEPVLVASGLGGDYLRDAAGYGSDAFLAVGTRSQLLANGDYVESPLLYRYVSGEWAQEATPDGVPPLSWMQHLATSVDLDVLATGRSSSEGWGGPLLLTRNDDAVWTVLDSPFVGQTVEVASVTGTDTTIELLVKEDADWFRYTFDAGAFVRTPINFSGGATPDLVGLVTFEGQTYLAGTAAGVQAKHVALWQLSGDVATEIEWPDPITGLQLEVDDVAVGNGAILISGTEHGDNRVWQLSIDMVSP